MVFCEISQARRRRYFSSAAGSLRRTRLTLGPLSENGGKTINFTADGVLYSGYILSEIEMDFKPDRMIGSLMIKLRGAE